MDLAPIAALVPLCCLVACSVVTPAAADRSPPQRQVAIATATASAPRTAAASDDASIAALRAEGPAALTRLLERYDRAHAEVSRAALARTIDRVAAQRYATVSRLYWYTDLAAAQEVARTSGKPILSLRMLGRLDEDLSCANSRMFRTILYPDAAVSQLLRERFVLHWSSERPVPTVTIDYGDGRTLATTVTGNSAHYVLDASGHVLDVLPGLYAPSVFRAELERAADVAAILRATAEPDAQRLRLAAHHRATDARLLARWGEIREMKIVNGNPVAPKQADVDRALAAAQRATVSKAYVEVPILKRLDLGADPGKLPDDLEVRVATAARLFGFEPSHRDGPAGLYGVVGGLLDDHARGLIASLLPTDQEPRERALVSLDQTIAADTLHNDLVLRRAIRARMLDQLGAGELPELAALNAWVYAEIFLTPATDPWLGMLPTETYTGLPGGAIIGQR